MTIPTTITKAELIAAVGRALKEAKRIEDAGVFFPAADQARDAQDVLALIPDDLEVEYVTND